MIAFLEGRLESKTTEYAILNIHGVGYRVEISGQTFEKLPENGEEIRLLIHHHITDNDQRLFGFFTDQEQRLFENLITVKGIGPKLGLVMMSGIPTGSLLEAIVQEDVLALSRVPGIGKKTAGRIVLELKDKMLSGRDPQTESGGSSNLSVREEAISALEALGFRTRDAEQAVRRALKENGDTAVSGLVKKALALLNG